MRLPLAIEFADGRQCDVTAGPADFIAFERKYQTSATVMQFKTTLLADDDGEPILDDDGDPRVVLDVDEWLDRIRMEWIYFLAWSVLRRQKDYSGKFDAFLEDVSDVNLGRAEQPVSGVDPTTTSTPPSAESLGSPSAPASTPVPSPPTPISSKRSNANSTPETENGASSASSSA